MADDRNVDRELGALDARMLAMERAFAEQKKDTHEAMIAIRSDVRMMRDTMIQAKGSWKMLVGIAGLSATIGALLMQIVSWLGIMPR
ncbi:hypothetical protein [Bauldia litoralis]|uniref:hypothetical protein n=1 Tax=Bauldia litoralis TaxID=665467 RepID=UPI0032665157